MKIWDLSNSFNDTFLYIKFDITLLYIIEKGTCFCKCLFLAQKERLELSRRFPDLRPSQGRLVTNLSTSAW